MKAKIIIIGAGASGLMAAIAAGRRFLAQSRQAGQGCRASQSFQTAPGCRTGQNCQEDREVPVLVLERMDKAGKKLLATGNGRCNFSNMHMEPDCFHSDSPKLVRQVLDIFSVEQTAGFFEELGIYIKNRDGYLYPLSGQASSVLDVLLMETRRLPVEIRTGCEVSGIKAVPGGYEVYGGGGKIYRAGKVIISCGGCAYPKLGSNGSGYAFAKASGLKVIPPVPALTGLYASQKYFREVAGVRADAQISLYIKKGENQVLAAKDRGEVQLTDYGVSGIPAFQVSRSAAKALAMKKKVSLTLDFMPDMSSGELFSFLYERARLHPERDVLEFLTGIFNYKLCRLFVKLSGLLKDRAAGSLSKRELSQFVGVIKALPADITGTGNFDNAQVCAGGVDGRELNPNLEAKKRQGLYFAGEVIDVDGLCGGYNLQWAWSSGYIAGSHAAKEMLREK